MDAARIVILRHDALAWLVDRLDLVGIDPAAVPVPSLPGRGTPPAGSPTPAGSRAEAAPRPGADPQAFAELALLRKIAGRFPAMDRDAGFLRIRRHLTAHVHKGIEAMRRSGSLPYCLRVALALEACGTAPESYRPLVLRALARYTEAGGGWQGWSPVELAYYLDVLGIRHDLPAPALLFPGPLRRTAVGGAPPRRSEAYRTTHAIFCVTDFGRVDARSTIGDLLPETCDHVEALLADLVAREDWDLVAETLMCCAFLGLRPEGLVEDAWEGLAGAGDHLARPVGRGAGPGAAARREREFADHYHTTVVTLMAALFETAGATVAASRPFAVGPGPGEGTGAA
ncbi:DUF6895 family protein [Streptomyces sp. NPDC057217]|uniref:DUF6895 family protein n=1 Tax=unclassified Streptomyces TaxID=2593676 RepID=UPI003634FB40